MNYIAGIEDVN